MTLLFLPFFFYLPQRILFNYVTNHINYLFLNCWSQDWFKRFKIKIVQWYIRLILDFYPLEFCIMVILYLCLVSLKGPSLKPIMICSSSYCDLSLILAWKLFTRDFLTVAWILSACEKIEPCRRNLHCCNHPSFLLFANHHQRFSPLSAVVDEFRKFEIFFVFFLSGFSFL